MVVSLFLYGHMVWNKSYFSPLPLRPFPSLWYSAASILMMLKPLSITGAFEHSASPYRPSSPLPLRRTPYDDCKLSRSFLSSRDPLGSFASKITLPLCVGSRFPPSRTPLPFCFTRPPVSEFDGSLERCRVNLMASLFRCFLPPSNRSVPCFLKRTPSSVYSLFFLSCRSPQLNKMRYPISYENPPSRHVTFSEKELSEFPSDSPPCFPS